MINLYVCWIIIWTFGNSRLLLRFDGKNADTKTFHENSNRSSEKPHELISWDIDIYSSQSGVWTTLPCSLHGKDIYQASFN